MRAFAHARDSTRVASASASASRARHRVADRRGMLVIDAIARSYRETLGS
jgi:hypothetical protein